MTIQSRTLFYVILLLAGVCFSSFWIGFTWGTGEEGTLLGVILLCTLLLLACLIAYTLSYTYTRRVHRVVEQCREVVEASTLVHWNVWEKDELVLLSGAVKTLQLELTKGDTIRNQLVSDVAHELRTPLAILRGQIESMLEGAVPLDKEQLVPLLDEIRRMSKLIHDLQQLSLAESGNLRLERTWTRFGELLEEITRVLELEAETKEISILFEGSSKVEVYCDYSRMKQVFINLIGNAIRYTPEGGEVRVVMEAQEDKVAVQVIDNGRGIPTEKLPYIFHRFYRVEDSRNRQLGGMGLGLAIAKEFVEAHGGSISVESELEKGTVFRIELPVFPLF